jgi:hypothetical protein
VVSISTPVLVEVMGGVVPFPGEWGGEGGGSSGDWGGVMTSLGGEVMRGGLVDGFGDAVVSSQGEDGGR